MITFTDIDNSEKVAQWSPLLKRKVFYIHGTISSAKRWSDWKEIVEVLNLVALPDDCNDAVDTAFDWEKEATLTNSLKERWPVSDCLVKYIKSNALKGDYKEIVLIGHSHGGNVAIMAADKLAKEDYFSTVYVITVGTPVFNKTIFSSTAKIEGLTQVSETVIEYVRFGTAPPNAPSVPIHRYEYYNPENPQNWLYAKKIKHLSIYNKNDRVDGIAQALDPFTEHSRMTSNTSTFEYNDKVNVGLKSNLLINERNRVRYCSYCLSLISVLTRLRSIVSNIETPVKVSFTHPQRLKGQDNLYIANPIKKIELLGFRKVTATLPEFKTTSLDDFLIKNPSSVNNAKNMNIDDMRFLFKRDIDLMLFTNKLMEESKFPLLGKYPYPMKSPDLRTPNIKKIDDEIEKLSEEINKMREFNKRSDADKIQHTNTSTKVIYIGSMFFPNIHFCLRPIIEGVNDHGFDINSPELIRIAIKEGRIKPFPREKYTSSTIR